MKHCRDHLQRMGRGERGEREGQGGKGKGEGGQDQLMSERSDWYVINFV